jgi:predicted transcriptional regulator
MLCLKALWSLGEGNVTEVRSSGGVKPLAYTTVMTVLDRLAKNVVTRRKVGGLLYMLRVSRTRSGGWL